MNIEKAAYWIALAVFGLALHSAYQRGEFPSLHRAAARASSELCQVATRAERTFAAARLSVNGSDQFAPTDEFMARNRSKIDRLLAVRRAQLNRAMALRQADLDRVQQQMEYVRVAMDRTQIEKLQGLDRMRVKLNDTSNQHMVVVCPATGARIAVDADMDPPSLDVDIDTQ